MKEFQFYDTTIDDHVENAFQALCLDEKRAAFSPALWEKHRDCTTVCAVFVIPCKDQLTDRQNYQ